ncbi:hypothetical protein JAAARDRAFT_52031 [Jaapia argillacea MUCL 33604]|uniref:Uncharacterized protein n=1 Tax=Jaapia argillacea MUCL 33604 TaxID=933084 RepID=A0A067QMZ2_9AGAM|nr:hypothetical protein JAAARDRAFT_52031 [Jaapia argillacea MUCL 33604]
MAPPQSLEPGSEEQDGDRAPHRCPREIWEQIFSFACLDGGSTGRSLSLVSKYIRDISQCVRYQSITVDGVSRLLALASLLESIPSGSRRVRHLLVSQTPKPPTPIYTLGIELRKPSLASRLRDSFLRRKPEPSKPTRSFISLENSPSLCDVLLRVLNAISHTIETLVIVVAAGTHIALPSPLPALRELTIYGGWNLGFPLVPEPGPGCTFPRLRRLYLVGSYYTPSQVFDTIRAAPNLTHLRFSGLESSVNVPSVVRAILGVRSDYHHLLPHRLPTIPKMLLQARDMAPFHCGCHEGRAHDFEDDTLVRLAEHYPEEEIVVLGPMLWNSLSGQVLEAKRSWLAGLEGRVGFWDETF